MSQSDQHDGDDPLDVLLERLAAALRATEEEPVTPAASVWLGEAHAVAADLVRSDLDRAVIHERVGHVQHLLENAGDPGNETAAEQVAEARAMAAAVRERTRATADEE